MCIHELFSEFADFSTANKQQADAFSDDDVCQAFCIPPIDKYNFYPWNLNTSKHFQLQKIWIKLEKISKVFCI